MHPSDEARGRAAAGEVQWTDDSIRWEGGLRVKTTDGGEAGNDDDASSEEEDYLVDPFKDPDPFEIFPFRFRIPDDETASDGDGGKHIDIRIRGYKKDSDEVWQSTGLTLWRASDYLCQYQMDNLGLFRDKRTLELGAGLGLNGILAWRSTVNTNAEVCITDGDSDALLIWGRQSSEQFLERIADNRKYDAIIASDIIYSPVIVEPLWETVRALLKRPGDGEAGGTFVMAYARRKVPVSIELVLEKAEEYGFAYELAKEDTDEGIWVYTFHFRA
ncbi:hypothetical protein ACHAXT_008089 [Thalassiosira profunda]